MPIFAMSPILAFAGAQTREDAKIPTGGVGAGTFPGLPVDAPWTSSEGARSKGQYDRVLDQFKVATNPRYKKNQQGRNETYCNIFVEDATKAMGCQIPSCYDDKTGKPGTFKKGKWEGGVEHNANGVVDWLNKFGPKNGWKKVSAEEAQKHANQGKPAVAAWKNNGGTGHVAMVRPDDAPFDPKKGPTIAQAGGGNFDKGSVASGFSGCANKSEIEYWVHD
jgi:hypothetical protein